MIGLYTNASIYNSQKSIFAKGGFGQTEAPLPVSKQCVFTSKRNVFAETVAISQNLCYAEGRAKVQQKARRYPGSLQLPSR